MPESKSEKQQSKAKKLPKDQKTGSNTASITTRGRTFRGKVVSTKSQKTATVVWDRRVYVKKYERYLTKRSKVKAHNPPEMGVKEGDLVTIVETRPLSKTKNFIITEVHKE